MKFPYEMGGIQYGRRSLVGVALLAAVAAAAEPAAAGRLTDFSQEELRSLSQVCLAQRFINEELSAPVVPEAERQQWEKTLGPSFIHYHHYCWAVLYARRAAKETAERKFNLERVVDNLNYVIRNSDPGFSLLPEVYLQKGEALDKLGQRDEAVAEYRNALRAKADYIPAYAALAQHYIDRGDVDAARGVLEQGLKRDPGSTALAAKKAALAERD